MVKFCESKPKTFKCENCGADITTTDSAEIQIKEYSAPSGNSLTRHPTTKLVFKVKLCKDCVDKAETVIAGWLDK